MEASVSKTFPYYHVEPNDKDIELSAKIVKAFEEDNEETLELLLKEAVKSKELKNALKALFEFVGNGQKVYIAPTGRVFSSKEAANFLDISNSYMNKLLRAETIPSHWDGNRRGIKFGDLIAYQAKRTEGSQLSGFSYEN